MQVETKHCLGKIRGRKSSENTADPVVFFFIMYNELDLVFLCAVFYHTGFSAVEFGHRIIK